MPNLSLSWIQKKTTRFLFFHFPQGNFVSSKRGPFFILCAELILDRKTIWKGWRMMMFIRIIMYFPWKQKLQSRVKWKDSAMSGAKFCSWPSKEFFFKKSVTSLNMATFFVIFPDVLNLIWRKILDEKLHSK